MAARHVSINETLCSIGRLALTVQPQLWSKDLPEPLLSVEFDRFNPEELWAASVSGGLYHINGTGPSCTTTGEQTETR